MGNDSWKHLTVHVGQSEWELETIHTVLEAPLRTRLSSIVQQFKRGAPIAPSLIPFNDDGIVRPPNHNRAFYLPLDAGAPTDYLGVKGTEPLLIDQLRLALGMKLHRG